MSAGKKFRNALKDNKPLIIPGTINAYSAILAEKSGHQAIYLSGGGVAAASYGIPDLGITSLEDVLTDVKRITNASSLPLLVDIDTGWGGAFNISKTIKSMIDAGCGAVHMEDQVSQKRCGHRPNKSLVTKEEMQDRIKAAVDGRHDESFFIMARTDAVASEGIKGAIDRISAYVEDGADGIFLEAATSLKNIQQLKIKLKFQFLQILQNLEKLLYSIKMNSLALVLIWCFIH
jgi:methylisocitrate lyase